ncbi:MAG TPA: hypothetical protein VG328_10335 [Stellaceae bacterium]|jgi:hypothetical protein|nr:hypothetical protein [Stellaceae bacterium]
MGTWGTGIFADDDAADVRGDFKHYVADTQSIAAATDAIALDFGASFEAPQNNTGFWLALALTQWRSGWLDKRVHAAAMRLIAVGVDAERWSKAEARKRAAVLEGLKAQLQGPQPVSRPIPPPWPVQLAEFRIGEIIGRALPNGRLALMKVIAFRRTISLKVRGPAVRLQKWTENRMPCEVEARQLDFLRWPIAPNKRQTFGMLVLTAPRSRPIDSAIFVRPGLTVPLAPEEERTSYTCVSTWPPYDLDDILASGIARWWEDPTLSAKAAAPWYKSKSAETL